MEALGDNRSDDIVNMHSTCLVCKHASIVCDRSIEDVDDAVLESKWSSLPI